MFSFYAALIMFHVVISKTSNKKKRGKFLKISDSVNFFRDIKIFENDARMENAKKKYQFLRYEN